ncbi:DNA-binding transcription factor [Malassezia pachydermatis]
MIFDEPSSSTAMSQNGEEIVPDPPEMDAADFMHTPQSGRMEESMTESELGNSMYKRTADQMEGHTPSSTGSRDAGSSGGTQKQKSTRGARACTNCHRLKMKCEGAENGGPCLRCARSGHECIFLESNRGRKSDKRRKTAAMQQSLKKVEHMLVSLLQNMNDTPAATMSPIDATFSQAKLKHRSTKPGADTNISPAAVDMLVERVRKLVSAEGLDNAKTHSIRGIAEQTAKFMQQLGLLDETTCSNLFDPSDERFLKKLLQTALKGNASMDRTNPSTSSDKMDSTRMPHLPDNTLNPLGLFAEASLQNWQRNNSENQRNKQFPHSSRHDSPGTLPGGDTPGVEGLNQGALPHGQSGASKDVPRQYGVANESYFHSSTMTPMAAMENGGDSPPELLTEGIVSSEEALELFRIFFHHCSLHMFLLDPEWHTPTFVCSRSPFLFTCVCAVASKFYTRRRDLYVQCQRRAIKSAFDVMSRGHKSPEIVQGFLLLTLYNQPVERYEEDRTWLFAGVAIRMAQDLNLHRKTVMSNEEKEDENKMRDVLNRERTWYICFCVDRTLSAQMGKPYSIREDFLIRHAAEWCLQPFSRPWDLGICALVDLLRVQTRQLDFLYSSTVTPSGLNVDLDYPAILPSFNEQLSETMQFWYRLGLDSVTRTWRPLSSSNPQTDMSKPPHPDNIALTPSQRNKERGEDKDKNPDTADKDKNMSKAFLPLLQNLVMDLGNSGVADTLRVSTLLALHQAGPPGDDADLSTRSMYYIARQAPLRYNYAILVLNSFGLQYALERPSDGISADKPQYLVRCVHAAKEIIATVKYGMREILRYAPDPTFVVVAYACVFLLKLIQPMFAKYINEEEIIALVNNTIEVLEEAAVDPSHTPALYASFLRSLVQSRHESSMDSASHGHAAAEAGPSGAGATHAASMGEPHRAGTGPANDPSLAPPPRSPTSMTVDPTQVNPMVAELAASDPMHMNNAHGSELELDPSGVPTTLSMPMDTSTVPISMPAPHDTFPDIQGWDAMQYAKAQGVDVNRVLDNSFWASLLPPGYGSGGPNPVPSFDLSRESDLFRPSSASGGRAALTPGATRASSPTLMLGHFPL